MPGPLIAFALFAVAFVKFSVLAFCSSRFVPVVDDEWSYLFAARTIALGRLVNPPPPLPKFFDAIHIIADEERWVSRYPPGHPMFLALGVLVGWPPLPVLCACAGAVVLCWHLASWAGGRRWGIWAALLALLSTAWDRLATGYLSQSTFILTMLVTYVAAVRAWSEPWTVQIADEAAGFGNGRRRLVLAGLAGLGGGWALLSRPYSAVAFGLPLACWVLYRTAYSVWFPQRGRAAAGALTLLAAASVPLAGAVALFCAYNHATTGSALKTAWQLYNERYEPANTLGFSDGGPQPVPRGEVHWRKLRKARSIAADKQRFTVAEAFRRSFLDAGRITGSVLPSFGFAGLAAVLAFSAAGLVRRREGAERDPGGQAGCSRPGAILALMLAAVVCHYAAYGLFYATWGVYLLEPAPFLIVLGAAGLAGLRQQAERYGRGLLGLLPAAVLLVAAAQYGLVHLPRFVQVREAEVEYYRKFAKLVAENVRPPAVVFVRFDARADRPRELIVNEPDLKNPVWMVLDLGERNRALIGLVPDRRAYLFDEGRWVIEPLKDPPAGKAASSDGGSADGGGSTGLLGIGSLQGAHTR
jgi:hypothetical protein